MFLSVLNKETVILAFFLLLSANNLKMVPVKTAEYLTCSNPSKHLQMKTRCVCETLKPPKWPFFDKCNLDIRP